MDKSYFACFIIFIVFTCESRGSKDMVEKRWANFMTLTANQVFVKITPHHFKYFVMPPRNYSLMVMFTNSNQKCLLCQRLITEFNVVVNSYKYLKEKNDGLFFAIVEADKTMSGGVKSNRIPEITYFSADEDLTHSMVLRDDSNAEDIADWILQVTSIPINITYPYGHGLVINSTHVTMLFLFGLFGVLYYKRLFNISCMVYGAVGFCQVLSAGHMWNYIKKAPFLDWSSYPPAFLHPSHMMQYLTESIIITVLYGIFAGGMILIIEGLKQNHGSHTTEDNARNSEKPSGLKPMTKCSVGVKLVMFSFLFVLVMFIGKKY
ncbi:magnesium transporter protein 1 isoform X1 [Plutella xylostella]|uniref:magnesium transporter protein 1 isoform X1 n=1 Tax=Plutella xylostella TaxID=51655 RepID=UPI002033053E|nr:magnesium transporter protein 1 isoform X1 [Plutella xylostella]